MNTPFAIAFGIAGIVLMIAAFVLWRDEDNLPGAVMVGVPGFALVAATVATLVGVGA